MIPTQTMNMSQKDFKAMLKDRFIFCYSCELMNFLRHRNIRYLVKGVHENTLNPFWVFDRTDEISDILADYKDRHNKDIPKDLEFPA